MDKIASLIALAALSLGATVWAGLFSIAGPTRLQPDLDRVISDAIHDFQPVAESGIAVAVIKDGALYYSGGFGFRDRGSSAKVDPQTFFGIGSATKAFTSMAISLLAETNTLRLDRPVREYLADFAMKDTEATNKMTLQDILSHRSGLPRHDALWYMGPFTRSQLFYRLRYLDPSPGAFGKLFQYNNMMYMVAGYLLETIGNDTWENFVKTRIFDRLNMPESNFSIRELSKRSNYAKGYEQDTELPLKDVENIGPAGEINSNVVEMTSWLLLFLNHGRAADGTQIIAPAALEKMYEKHVDVPPVAYTPAVCTSDPTPRARVAESGLGYGWGWFVTTILNKRLVLHPGNTDGYSAFVSFMPHDALAVIVLTNQHNTPFPNKVALRIYQYLLTHPVADKLRLPEMLPHTEFFQLSETAMHRASVPSSRAAYPSYTGMFSDPGYGDISVNLFGDGLHISYYQHSWPLRLSADTFYFCMRAFGTDFKVPVVFNETNGVIDSLSIPFQPQMPIRFIKR